MPGERPARSGSHAPAVGAQAVASAADTGSMRRALALTSAVLVALCAAGAAQRRPAGSTRRPSTRAPPSAALVGRRPDPRRHGRGDPRRRSRDIQAHRPAHARRARRRARGLGQAVPQCPPTRRAPSRCASSTPSSSTRSVSLPAARRIRIAARDARTRAHVAARHGDGRAPARSPPQPPAGLGRSRAAAHAAGDARRGGVLVRTGAAPHPGAARRGSTSSARRSRCPSSTTGSARCSAGHSASSATRTSGPAPRRRRRSSGAPPRRAAGSRLPAGSTARASCGASTRRSRSRARRCSATSSRAGRPTR